MNQTAGVNIVDKRTLVLNAKGEESDVNFGFSRQLMGTLQRTFPEIGAALQKPKSAFLPG